MSYKELIADQEKKDRYIAARCIKEAMNDGYKVKIKPAGITSHIDLRCQAVDQNGYQYKFNVEIKERFKDDENLEKFPYAELKVEKYNNMVAMTPDDTLLYYIVLLNEEKALFFDIFRLDWSNIKTVTWNIKQTQMNAWSEYIPTPVYMIPYDQAEFIIDCSIFYQEWTEKNKDK